MPLDRTTVLCLLVCPIALACVSVNPAFEDGQTTRASSSTVPSESGSGDTATAGPTTTAMTGGSETASGGDPPTSGEAGSDSETTNVDPSATDSDPETDPSTGTEPVCGNSEVEDDEECDDGNDANDDGCLSNCMIPKTCAEILEYAPESASGTYLIDPQSSGFPWPAACNMLLDDGGWTGFTLEDTCNDNLSTTIVTHTPADSFGFDENCRPFAENIDGGSFNYHLDIHFPPGFSAFYFDDYTVKAIGEPELKFVQEVWTIGVDFPNGSLSLGSASDDGPRANWAEDGGMQSSFAPDEEKLYPMQKIPFELLENTEVLRIGWAETTHASTALEGLFPWWSGRIYVR